MILNKILQLAKELHKPIIRKLKKKKFMPDLWLGCSFKR